MNHNPSKDSANVPRSGRAVVADGRSETDHRTSDRLNPALQQALSCLDIKLEDELMRFRAKQEAQADERHSVLASTGIEEEASTGFDADAEIVTAHIVDSARTGTIIEGNGDLDRVVAPEPAPKGGFIIIDKLITSSTNSPDTPAINNYGSIEVYRSNVPIHNRKDANFGSSGEMAPFQNEYSSSSQELLRQIQSGYRDTTSERRDRRSEPTAPKRKFFTPLKIGSAAAVCVLAGGAAYTYLNPSILASFTATKQIALTATTTNSLGQLIQSPNLAANEFSQLNLSTLNTIELPKTTTAARTAPTSTIAAPTGVTTAPAAIPFNQVGTRQIVPPTTTITSQPRLADSLVKSLLPPSFRVYTRPTGFRASPSGTGR
ncbi:hypothetical protein [Chamaesiphon minutus]|uniref:Uncharacterized protein n=1 Tax=Chamaesiphon minutus (strain ATCC 27169 / PCC 6605) TaxID=1173020 RepID=K9UA54_CHAP6|nr:hypothetical protein [Chamaesiphon minutus]AFY91992.1 hypothetical protein Cha6605_0721 [Chamaesiphon minutus PCC 6605]